MDQGPHPEKGKTELLDLNDDDLLHILSFLASEDGHAVSKTCTRLKELCLSAKSLWRSLNLKLGQGKDPSNNRVLKLTEVQKEVLEVSGDIPQQVHISVDYSTVNEFNSFDLLTLERKSRTWNLKTFFFEALPVLKESQLNSVLKSQLVSFKTITPMLTGILQSPTNAGLETLSLSAPSWGFAFAEYRRILVDMPPSLSIYKSVKSLALDSFFWYNHSKLKTIRGVYIRYIYALGRDYCEVIRRFKNLQMLEINYKHLSFSLVEALSQPDRVSLQNLTIVIDDDINVHENLPWAQLRNSSPSLKVTVESLYDIDWTAVSLTFNACVPIVSWKIYFISQVMSFNCIRLRKAFRVLRHYRQSLQSVALQNDSEMLCHSALLEMITQCSNVQTLYLEGRICSNTIQEIASLQRQWIKLGVWERDIMFPENQEENREKSVARLCREVSEKLGCKWKPELGDVHKTVFNRPMMYPVSVSVPMT